MILAIIQARMGSTRLPGKTLMKVGNDTLLGYELKRVRLAKRLDHIVVATTTNKEDDVIAVLCQELGVDCFRGLVDDVLDRYYQCSLKYLGYKTIVRITGDCPLIDPAVIDAVIEKFLREELDYASNILEETFPDGMDVEVFKKEALEKAARNAKQKSEREHVTLYIRNQPGFRKGNLEVGENYSRFRLTVDRPEDLEVIEFVVKSTEPNAGYQDYVNLLLKHPEILEKNSKVVRNEGLIKSLRENRPPYDI